jgi:hypothetical protein
MSPGRRWNSRALPGEMRALAISVGTPARRACASMFGHSSVSTMISSRGRSRARAPRTKPGRSYGA